MADTPLAKLQSEHEVRNRRGELFAAAALQGLLANEGGTDAQLRDDAAYKALALRAWKIAEAMVEVGKGRPAKK